MHYARTHLSGQSSICYWLVAALLFCVPVNSAYAAGISTTVVAASGQDGAIEVLVWSPCASTTSDLSMGPYIVHATKDCAVAGSSLPLVVISHGRGGTRLGHHDTAEALANAGFVVASFNHPGDTFGDESSSDKVGIFESRPRDVSRVITHMLDLWKFRKLIDKQSVGVFGFSRGGFTALALAGAVPSQAATASRFCGSWRSFVISFCRQLHSSAGTLTTVHSDPRVRSVVAVDPLNLFGDSSFTTVTGPVQLWASELGGDGVEMAHIQFIRERLPRAPEYFVAKGAGHFAFLAPCSEALRKESKEICEDPKGFDRERWHSTMNQAITAFFISTLRIAGK